MAKLTKDSVFKDVPTRPETALDKTTRIVREITEGEAEKRQIKMARLRSARLEREANTPDKPAAKTRKKPPAKAAS
jgi:hypothetical protein